jgi:HPr kinase/phosphorylase
MAAIGADNPNPTETRLHASCVAYGPAGLLILGPSGSGKSSLALRLMALGAGLVADDQVCIRRDPSGALIATAPSALKGLIEARGVGLLDAENVAATSLSLIADMGTVETDRLPPRRFRSILGRDLPLVHKSETETFPAALLQYLKGARRS